jgi:2-oxo-4-hydroxy-4-carboxy-5-ureidoimidazoline decarboxylase
MTIDGINGFDRGTFVAAFGGIYEHSPWVAERAFAQAPFASRDGLHAAMSAAVHAATPAEQLALIRAHPQLAGKAAIRGELTEASTREQQGAGLDQCSPEEYARLTALNTAYHDKFGFPFIVAVRGHTRASIIAAMQARLANDIAHEQAEALRQIDRIAGFRLQDLIRD